MEEKLAATFVKKKQENRVLKTFKKNRPFSFLYQESFGLRYFPIFHFLRF